MWAIGSPRPSRLDRAWAVFALANVAAMLYWPRWETVPFHFIWVSLTLLYGFRVWALLPTFGVLALVVMASGWMILEDISMGAQVWGELTEVPLMSAMFLAMVWHARRRQSAIRSMEAVAENRASLLIRQERFLHDVSHELRTPVTIARGHLELARWDEPDSRELAVALDELARIDRIISRLLLLAKADRPDFVVGREVDVEPFLEDVFLRWSDVAPRVWRLGRLGRGVVWADEEALRVALDALLENAVKYTEPHEIIEVSATAVDDGLAIEVADGGRGVAPESRDRIFERFGRADDARTRELGGAGLGLAIVSAIGRAHGGSCSVAARTPQGTVFRLWLPAFRPAPRPSVADWVGGQTATAAASSAVRNEPM